MDDSFINDPQLRSLEERLGNMVLRMPSGESQQLLYQCAFAAGHKMARRTVWRWQAVAVALVVLSLSLSVSLVREDRSVAKQAVKPFVPVDVSTVPSQQPPEIPPLARVAAEVKLDAWQVERSASESISSELARFAQTDASLRSYAMGAMTRSVLQP